MTEEFLTIYRLIGLKEIEEDGGRISAEEFSRRLRDDPELLEDRRSFVEMLLTTTNRKDGEALLRLLFSTTCYMSNLLDGPVAVLLPRSDVNALVAAGEEGFGTAMSVARSLKLLARAEIAGVQAPRDEALLAQLEEIVARVGSIGVPSNQRYMNTEQIGKLLDLAPKTVRRLFNEKKLFGRKVGNEWRATREQLENSPYLRKRRRKADAALE